MSNLKPKKMTKKFSLLQLFSLADGRLSTSIEDVTNMLEHVCDTELMTHHLPVAMDYVKNKNPKWFQDVKAKLDNIKHIHRASNTFESLIYLIKEEYKIEYDIPQLKDEFDTSDFGKFMLNNNLLLKKQAA